MNSGCFSTKGDYLVTVGENHVKFWYFDNGEVVAIQAKDKPEYLIMEGVNSNLKAKFLEKTYVDVKIKDNNIYLLTQDGLLCLI